MLLQNAPRYVSTVHDIAATELTVAVGASLRETSADSTCSNFHKYVEFACTVLFRNAASRKALRCHSIVMTSA